MRYKEPKHLWSNLPITHGGKGDCESLLLFGTQFSNNVDPLVDGCRTVRFMRRVDWTC
jgi:hypothetical protein